MDYYESRDNIYDNIQTPSDEKSQIEDFYNDSNILVTGVTGFIGNLVVEKLLRCCPGIKKIYFLIRIKKNVPERERALEIINESLFAQVRRESPDFINKIVVVASDCSLPNLGLSAQDRHMMLDTNIVFHVAATLRFDDHFRNSFVTNVQATKDLLEMAKDMKDLKAFTYVSTAYAHIGEEILKEEFIKSKYSYTEVKTMMDNLTDDEITGLMPKLLSGEGTTYSFMKSIAENVVEEYYGKLPVGIVRPSIVISTEREPLECWIKGFNGPTAIMVGVLLGIMRVLNLNKGCLTDLIPADKVASAIVAATWDITDNRRSSAKPPVYNIVSYKKSPLTWEEMSNHYVLTDTYHENLASKRSMWEPFGILTESRLMYNVLYLFLHIIPGLMIDLSLQFKGKNPLLMKLYRKAYYLMDVMFAYNKREWRFEDNNLYAIWDKMSAKDKHEFNFSLVGFDWTAYYYNYVRGLKVYLLKEPNDLESMQKVKRRRKIFKVIHYSLCTLLILFGLWLVKWMAIFVMKWQQ